ncbi:uncharacterized protein LOC125038248 isoform X1 [Penaeus chinensis]|uniref:uncharacterized protein LOC125038248 isoform X1 n=1 Tax=Penaeus chinensis TaxID=139456 RepID=UPI001FB64EAE|nr:uncharacterized protein LOC125038248 isoform X1 [Penaeus chinensis]
MTCAYTVYIHLTLKSPSERNDGQESNTGHSLGGIRRGFTCRVKTCPAPASASAAHSRYYSLPRAAPGNGTGIRLNPSLRIDFCEKYRTCHRDGRCSSTSPSFHISSRSIDMGLRIFELFQICMFT